MTVKFPPSEMEAFALRVITAELTAGRSPTLQELASLMGRKSKGQVHELVTALVHKGHLMRMRGRARALALPDAGEPIALQPAVAAALDDFCRRRGEAAGAVIADAIMLHIDATDRALARGGET